MDIIINDGTEFSPQDRPMLIEYYGNCHGCLDDPPNMFYGCRGIPKNFGAI